MMVSKFSWDHIYYILFCKCIALLNLLPAITTCVIMFNQNHFFESNWHMLDFFSSIFIVQDHILSTIGDILRTHTLRQSLYKKFKYLYKRKKLHIVQAHKKIPSCPWLFWNVWQWIWQNLQWCKMGWDRNKRDWCIYETGQHTYWCNWCKSEGRAWNWKQCFNLVSCS